MKKIAYILLVVLSVVSLQNCEDTYLPPTLEYVTFGKTVYTAGVDVGGTKTVEIPVYTGNIVATDRTFDLVVDGSAAAAGSYTAPTTVTIPGGTNKGTLTVGLSDTNLGIGVNKVTIKFVADGETTIGAATRIDYTQNCTEVTGTFDIRFNYGEEASWTIKDALGGVVASGSYTGSTSAYTTLSIPITLCSGRNYTLTTTDAYGDGWGATGSYKLTIGGVVKVTGNGSLMDNGGTGPISSSVPFNTN